ncbi:hypothetical protein H312_00925 [Anncaliia algerae PRA339]|uniref:Uncharacterized protein n=1 Tax=Anncaliia algerae PRA339 TaxID=1288291 RepID=A0A059F3T8_9MICR|nr:hypothetical protein H312_00925 [Anncaliia algerae PRA339]
MRTLTLIYSMELNDSYIENKKYFNISEDIPDKEIVIVNKKEIKNGKKFRKKKKKNEKNKSKLATEEEKKIKKKYFELKIMNLQI